MSEKTRITCFGCGKRLRLPEDSEITTIHCPKCQSANPLPGSDAEPDDALPSSSSQKQAKSNGKASRFCRFCGAGVARKAEECSACGKPPREGRKCCPTCAVHTHPDAVVCVRCGGNLGQKTLDENGLDPTEEDADRIYPIAKPKDPALMCLLSILLVGLGEIVSGQKVKGGAMILLILLTGVGSCGWGFVLYPLYMVISAVDAYRIAAKLKSGQSVGQWEFF